VKVRFGEFSRDHHFILITRPFVEWSFKYLGWLALTSTIRVAREKTQSLALLIIEWFAYGLILGFNGAFSDWIASFKSYPQRTSVAHSAARRIAGIIAFFLFSLLSLAIVNFVSQSMLDALTKFHQNGR
jgi:hypothetical protein